MNRPRPRRIGRPSAAERAEREGVHGAVLRAIADPTRRQIVLRLAETPLAVRDIAKPYPVSRPMISKHLRVLVRAGLVRARASGRERIYHLAASKEARLALSVAQADAGYKDAVGRLRSRLEGQG